MALLPNFQPMPTATNPKPAPINTLGVQVKSPVITPTTNTAPASQVKAPAYDYSQYSIDSNPDATTGGKNIYKNGVKQDYNTMSPLFTSGFDVNQIKNINQPTVQNTVQKETPKPTDFPGQVGNIIDSSAQGNPTVGSASQGLLGTGAFNPALSGPAYQDYQTKVNQLQDLKSGIAKQYSNVEQTPIPLEFQQGREQVMGRQYASQLDAAQQAVNQAQSAIGLQIQGTQTQQAGYNQAGALGNTAQGLQQSGLISAAGLSQPQLGQYGQGYYSPTQSGLIGGGSGGGSLNPLNNISSIAQQVVSGQISPSQAYSMGGSVSNWQGALNAELQKQQPGFDMAKTQAAFDAKQGSATAQGMQVQAYTSAHQQGMNLQAQLGDLITKFGLNPADISKANAAIQTIASNVSDPRYQILQNYMLDVANVYSQILTPPGGSATDTTRGQAASMINSIASGSSIMTVMQALDQQAQAKIAGIPTSGGSGSGSGSYTSSSGTSYKLPY